MLAWAILDIFPLQQILIKLDCNFSFPPTCLEIIYVF